MIPNPILKQLSIALRSKLCSNSAQQLLHQIVFKLSKPTLNSNDTVAPENP